MQTTDYDKNNKRSKNIDPFNYLIWINLFYNNMKEVVYKSDLVRLEDKVDRLSMTTYIIWGIVVALQFLIPSILKS